jgi:hypothetical protein
MFLDEMTPEEQAREMDEFHSFLAEMYAEEQAMSPEEKLARSRAEARLIHEEWIGEQHAAQWAFD